MRLHRFLEPARVALMLVALLAVSSASFAAPMASVSTTILDSRNQPISGARVVFTGSAGTTFAARTDANGHVSIKIPVDTYTIVASRNGYSSESLSGMMIAADTSLSMSIGYAFMPPPATAAHAAPAVAASNGSQPRVVAAAPAAAAMPAAPPPPLVHDSLLATYDGHHPEHVAGEPYFGRYTYVILAGSGPTDPRNRALVAALVAKYGVGANGGTQTVLANPYGYNIFFLPVNESRDAAASNTTDALLAAYDYKSANNLRLRYCSDAAHSATSICTKPLANGPFMLTFARPLNSLRKHQAFPPAYGYDLSLVGPDQYAPAVAIVARATSVPEAMQADVMLPPADLTKYVGPTFVASAAALRVTVPMLKVYPDPALNG
jgi:hypothetical protein